MEAGVGIVKLIYNGTDIYDSVTVKSARISTHDGRMSDTVKMTFANAANTWNKWDGRSGDTLRVIDEEIDTGTLTVNEFRTYGDYADIYAIAMPRSMKERRTKTWSSVRLYEVVAEIAKRNGLDANVSGVADRLYPALAQRNETDAAFLQRLCTLEGAAFVVWDGTLTVYDQLDREQSGATGTVYILPEDGFAYSDNRAAMYRAAELVCGTVRGAYTDTTVDGDRVLRITSGVTASTDGEAGRFARGLLRDANKGVMTGSFTVKLKRSLAAGSVVNISNARAGAWNGTVVLTDVHHHLAREQTTATFRRVFLEGY